MSLLLQLCKRQLHFTIKLSIFKYIIYVKIDQKGLEEKQEYTIYFMFISMLPCFTPS